MKTLLSKLTNLITVAVVPLMTHSTSASAQSLRDRMLGTWNPESWHWTDVQDGQVEPGSFGADAIGHVMYQPDGHMCAILMQKNRAAFEMR